MDLLALFCITAKNVIYGSSVIFTGRLTETTNVFDVLSIRFLITFAVLFLLKKLSVLRINVDIKQLFAKGQGQRASDLILCAIFEPVLYMIFETFGISMTTGVTAGVILALAPIIACLMEVILLKEKGSFLRYVFIAIGMIGVLYITVKTDTSTGENSLMGIIFMFLAVLSGVFFTAFVRKSTKYYSAIEISYVSAGFGAVVFNVINVVRHIASGSLMEYFKPLCTVENIIGFVFLSIVSSILATAMGNYSLKKMHISTAAAFSGLSMLVTIAISVILNNEQLFYYHYIGIALILVRIFGVVFLEKNKE